MKQQLLVYTLLLLTAAGKTQGLYNNGATINVSGSTHMHIAGSFSNQAGSSWINNGTVSITGNVTNNQVMSQPYNGTLRIIGTAPQMLSGASPYLAQQVQIDNAAGMVLNNRLSVNGTLSFISGVITAAANNNPVWFTPAGVYTGATDASHVDGFVVKEGNGSFSYPVGNSSKLQITSIDLSANSAGMRVKYYAADAGTGNFTAGGTESTPLLSYNNNEYWDIAPVGSATGTVTVYWDGYNDGYGNPASQRKVAHKSGGNWLNEGTTATGTNVAGSVTSNSLSSWSPFTLGSVTSVLPLQWLSLNGSLNGNKNVVVNWTVQEMQVAFYEIESSTDGKQYTATGRLSGKGNGTNSYSFTDQNVVSQPIYYRVKQVDVDGKFSYSNIIRFNSTQAEKTQVYPIPFTNQFTIVSDKMQKAKLVDIQGKILQLIQVQKGTTLVYISGLTNGIYFLQLDDGTTIRLQKQ